MLSFIEQYTDLQSNDPPHQRYIAKYYEMTTLLRDA